MPPDGKTVRTPVQIELFGGLTDGRSLKTVGPTATQVLETHWELFGGDEKARGFRTMFYDNGDRAGGSVYDGLGKGEANELVFKFRIYSDGNKIDGIEVLTQISPVSFTPRVFREVERGTGRCHLEWETYEGRVV